MSTTVTYKGQTLTTVENQTKTLQTAGTWVEGDFTLTDVTQGGGAEVSSINLMDGVGLYPGYILSTGNISAQSTEGQNELYTDEIDISAYGGQRVYVVSALESLHNQWVAVAFYDENHTFKLRNVVRSNFVELLTSAYAGIDNSYKYMRITFRSWDGVAIVAFIDGFYNFMVDAGATVVNS